MVGRSLGHLLIGRRVLALHVGIHGGKALLGATRVRQDGGLRVRDYGWKQLPLVEVWGAYQLKHLVAVKVDRQY